MGVGGKFHALASLLLGKTRYPLYRRLGGPQGQSGRVQEILPSPGVNPRTVKAIASRYTDWCVLFANVCCENSGDTVMYHTVITLHVRWNLIIHESHNTIRSDNPIMQSYSIISWSARHFHWCFTLTALCQTLKKLRIYTACFRLHTH